MIRRQWLVFRTTMGVLVLACCGACGEPLLAENEPRSQYDRYDALRGQRPPAFVTDEFGIDKPNLRGRLLRRD